MTRALVVRPGPQFSVADVARGWVEGLRANDVEVVDFNFDDRLNFFHAAHLNHDGEWRQAFPDPEHSARIAAEGLKAACYELWPDVVLIVSGFFVPPDVLHLIRSRQRKLVMLHTESPYEDDKQMVRAQYVDFNVLNDPTNLEQFRQIGPSDYIPHAYDPALHHPQPPVDDARSDFCFVGTGYPSRIEFFERCDFTGIDVALAGNWEGAIDSPLAKFLAHDIEECCPNDQAATLYASTKASANLYRKEATASADGWAMGPREVEMAAMGTFFLREPRGEGDEILSMLPTFDSPEDFTEKLRWWLDHDTTRDAAADLARQAVADRTFAKNAARLLSLLGL